MTYYFKQLYLYFVCSLFILLSPLALAGQALLSAPFIGIGAGSYSDNRGFFFPLLASSSDGSTWVYPKKIFHNLKGTIPNFVSGQLNGASCSVSATRNICIVAGDYCTQKFCGTNFPLLATQKNNLSWKYSNDIINKFNTSIDPMLTGGNLLGASCSGAGGDAVCISSGYYFTTSQGARFPLIAFTADGGGSWSYPPSVYQNLKEVIDPNFQFGSLAGASCSPGTTHRTCIAAGSYCADANCDFTLPLVALSNSNGSIWSYPADVLKNLKSTIDPNFQQGSLNSASCAGNKTTHFCIATGQYANLMTTLPLLTQTKDNGNTWTYPKEIYTNLETVIGHGFKNGFFNAASCTGNDNKTVCVAAGAFDTGHRLFPLLAVTRNSGASWIYPDFIYTKLRTVVDPNLTSAIFNGASCAGTSNLATCVAVGNYCHAENGNNCQVQYPLAALSTDGGKSWSYPTDIFTDLNNKIDPNFSSGTLDSVTCSETGGNTICIAAGNFSNGSQGFPLLAISTDNGKTWSYPPSIFQNLSTTIDPKYAVGSFISTGLAGSLAG